MYKVINSGSTGNAVIYFDSILVDCGVPFAALKPFLHKIQVILLTHEHGDHLNLSTLRKIVALRPAIRIVCGQHLAYKCDFVRFLDVIDCGVVYDYKAFQIASFSLYHDVPNFGYRIFKDGKKVFHATDTAHLEGITAKNYDLYALEHNYNEETVCDYIAQIEMAGGFAHQRGAINSHLSEQQANDFVFKNGSENSKILRLHESKLMR